MCRSPHCRRVSPLPFFHILDFSLVEYFCSSKSDVYSMYPTPGRLGSAEEMKQVRFGRDMAIANAEGLGGTHLECKMVLLMAIRDLP